MPLPVKTAVKEDGLSLQRTLRALEDARKSIKAFAACGSVANDPALAMAVDEFRHTLKKARKRARKVEASWIKAAVS